MFRLDELVDDRNRELYEAVSARVPIVVEPSDDEYWGALLKDGTARIACAPSRFPCSCFTHEMLHIECDLRGTSRPGRVIEANSKADYNDLEATVDGLLVYAYNQLIHHKMYPEFTRMGFPANEFLHEADDRAAKASVKRDIEMLRELKRKSCVHGVSARYFIYPYLFMRSPHDSSDDSRRLLKDIRNLADNSFYQVERIMADWIDDPMPHVPTYLARLFQVCGIPNVGFGSGAHDLVWARDCM